MQLEEIRDRFSFFSKVVPKNIENINQGSNQKLLKARNNVIVRQRLIILSPLMKEMSFPTFFNMKKPDFYDAITNESLNISDSIFPQYAQFVSKLYDHFIHSPVDLANITNEAYNIFDKDRFHFFCRSVIPSVFGFFSSLEHLSFAYQYFTALISSYHHELSIKVLEPFYQNSCVFRFIDSIASHSINSFFQDPRLSSKESVSKAIHEQAMQLSGFIIQSIPLLPVTHLNLLKLMLRTQWKKKEIVSFLLNSCIFPMLTLFIEASAFSPHVVIYQKMFPRIGFELMSSFDSWILMTSLYDIPSAFNDFNQQFVDFIVTPIDASILISITQQSNLLPKLLKMLYNSKYLEFSSFSPFWIKIFPRKRFNTLSSIIWKNVVFENENIVSYGEICYPAFQRRWRMIKSLAEENHCEPDEFLSSRTDFQLVPTLSEERGIDLNGLCDDCIKIYSVHSKLSDDLLCQKCGNIIRERKDFSFSDFMLLSRYDDICERAKMFELFLIGQMAFKSFEAFVGITDDMFKLNIIVKSQPIILSYFHNNISKSDSTKNDDDIEMKNVLLNLSEYTIIKQQFLSMKYQLRLDTVINHWKNNRIQLLESQWMSLINSSSPMFLTQYFKHYCISKTKQIIITKYFMSASSSLNVIPYIPHYKRFSYLLQCARELKMLSPAIESSLHLFSNAIAICNTSELLTTVLRIGSSMMKNSRYLRVCTIEEKQLWFEIEGAIMSYFNNDDFLSSLYSSIHDEIISLM